MDALTACLKLGQSQLGPRLGDDTLGTIQELFGWLQKTIQFRNDEPTRRLAQLEWEFLSLLDGFEASPETLICCLSDDPKFFAQLIAAYSVQTTSESQRRKRRKSNRKGQSTATVC